MDNDRRIDCPHCGSSLSINSEEENIWFDTGDKVLLVPREILEYIEDSQGLIGIT
jgi:phage terminase large subunit GpA-like protein|tara:strand:+ start:89 stop:253 length:165 start_codon:yes stop_codon:yes gene_type:complete